MTERKIIEEERRTISFHLMDCQYELDEFDLDMLELATLEYQIFIQSTFDSTDAMSSVEGGCDHMTSVESGHEDLWNLRAEFKAKYGHHHWQIVAGRRAPLYETAPDVIIASRKQDNKEP